MFNLIKKRIAIKSYVRILPVVLKKKYGKRKHYSEINIRNAISSAKLNTRYIEYAFAIFLSKKVYNEVASKYLELDEYSILREIVAKRFFKGNIKFSIHDLLKNAHYRRAQKTSTTFNGNVSGSESAGHNFDGDI